LFRHAALFVLPSDLEGLPIVLLEALAYGVPVLASDIAPNVEVLGENGRYFRASDPASLAIELAACLREIGALKRCAQSLADRAPSDYDWDRVAGATEVLYERVIVATRR